jgi:transcriptional regulator with XRE-family HTH domain
MMDVKGFLKANNLKQVDLAKFLGVSDVAISNAVKGKSSFSEENLSKLLKNDKGWDTSMLTNATHVGDNRVTAKVAGNGSVSTNINYGSDECAVLKERIKYLENSLAEKERLIEEKERLINVLLDRK